MNKQEAKNEIKKHLWMWGHRVQDVGELTDYDLLVNREIKVKVMIAKEKTAKEKRTVSNCDMLAIYIDGKCKDKRRLYAANANGIFQNYFNIPNKIILDKIFGSGPK